MRKDKLFEGLLDVPSGFDLQILCEPPEGTQVTYRGGHIATITVTPKQRKTLEAWTEKHGLNLHNVYPIYAHEPEPKTDWIAIESQKIDDDLKSYYQHK